ncbi:aldo/keto reductase [Weissella oryzae SG25]|uniref:Aldo/keto reductase n=1 Tax=Weissella oryzae (strain DSM 25784 / JCM 18191 / LMG 30913 / SG25) TaxID=1329250 RepID=A0A069CTG8_WEIOS|nr:aldo/keto reductase [Weissella oryzae]GAK31115.1 aldo/keto reductase [Weissella oryzae SG25]
MVASVKIGHSNVETTKLGLGTNKVGGHNLFSNLKDADGYELVRAALDAGITMLDTAFVYGLGRSEEIIGDVIQDYDRSKLVIATKAAQDPHNNLALNNSPAFLKSAVEDALTRLKTNYIDIFYIHFPDSTTDKREAVAALHELKEAGKIRAIGVSNFSLDQIKAANADGYIDVVEDEYSLVAREAEKAAFPYFAEHNIAFVPYFPLASGLLTGKYQANQTFGPDDWQSQRADFQGERFQKIITAVETLKSIAQVHHAEPAQVALAWYIKNPAIAVVIPGARVASQVTSNAAALKIELSAAEYQAIDDAFNF